MKILAFAAIILAAAMFMLGLMEKLGIAVLTIVSPIGFVKTATVLLLLGINFELLELLHKKQNK